MCVVVFNMRSFARKTCSLRREIVMICLGSMRVKLENTAERSLEPNWREAASRSANPKGCSDVVAFPSLGYTNAPSRRNLFHLKPNAPVTFHDVYPWCCARDRVRDS